MTRTCLANCDYDNDDVYDDDNAGVYDNVNGHDKGVSVYINFRLIVKIIFKLLICHIITFDFGVIYC